MSAREFLRHYWHAITIAVTAVAIACAAIIMLSTLPPRLIVMATGPEGDAYHEIGERYRAELAGRTSKCGWCRRPVLSKTLPGFSTPIPE